MSPMPEGPAPSTLLRGAAPHGRLRHLAALASSLAVALAVVGLAPPAEAQALSPEVRARLFAPSKQVRLGQAVVRVPMRGADRAGNSKLPYFQVFVNGRGPFTFLFDTGAAYALVSSKVMAAARPSILVDRDRRDIVTLREIRFGGVVVKGVVAVHDDTFGVDGILGFPTLGASNLLFDLARRELFVSHTRIPMGRSFSLPFESPLNVPAIPVGIGTGTVQILVDTGDDAYGLELRSIELGAAALEHGPVPSRTVRNGEAKQSTAVVALKDPVVLGPVRALRATVAINDAAPIGDFGFDVLRQFRFQIDPTRRLVEFEPLFQGDEFRIDAIPAGPTAPAGAQAP